MMCPKRAYLIELRLELLAMRVRHVARLLLKLAPHSLRDMLAGVDDAARQRPLSRVAPLHAETLRSTQKHSEALRSNQKPTSL